jgi:hypothetical protein
MSKNKFIFLTVAMLSMLVFAACEREKITFTASGKIYSSGIDPQLCRMEFSYDEAQPFGNVNKSPFAQCTIKEDGSYQLEVEEVEKAKKLYVDFIGPSNEIFLRCIFDFIENFRQDFDITESRDVISKLISNEPLNVGDTLFLSLTDLTSEVNNLQIIVVPGPLDAHDVANLYCSNVQNATLRWSKRRDIWLDPYPASISFPMATERTLDTITIHY